MFGNLLNKINDNKIIFLILLCFISTIAIGNHETSITNLSGQYLLRSLHLFKNQEFTEFSRGPLYPIITAFFYNLFGVGVKTAIYVHYTFYLLSIILVYFISEKIFDYKVAILATIITILSKNLLDVALSVELAFIYTFFILLSILFLTLAIDKRKIKYFIFSGISISLGFLTKEIVLFYVFSPFLILILKRFRKKFYFKGLFFYLISFIICVLPWALLAFKNNSLSDLIGEFGGGGGANISFYGASNYIFFIFKSLTLGFFKSIINLQYKNEFAGFFILSVIFIFLKDVILDRRLKSIYFFSYLIVAFFILAPFGLFLDGFRQITINIVLLNISSSYLLVKIIEYIIEQFNLKNKRSTISAIFILLIFFHPMAKLLEMRLKTFNNFQFNVTPIGRLNDDLLELSKIIKDLPNDSLCFNFKSDHSLMYLTELNYEYVRPKLFTYLQPKDFLDINLKNKKDEMFLIRYHPNFKSGQQRHRSIEILYKEDLINYFNIAKKTNCLLITDYDNKILDSYIDKNDLIFENRYKLYKVNDYDSILLIIKNTNNKKFLDSFVESDFMKYLKNESYENFKMLIKLK